MKKIIALVFYTLCSTLTAYGTELMLKDGTVCRGEIISDNGDYLTFQVGSKNLKVNKLLIVRKDGVPFAQASPANLLPLKPAADRSSMPENSEKSTMPSQKEWVVSLRNGTVFRGKRISENTRLLVLESKGSPVSIYKNMIIAIDSGGGNAPVAARPATVTPERPVVPKSAVVAPLQAAADAKTVVPVKPRPADIPVRENMQPPVGESAPAASSSLPQTNVPLPKKIKVDMVSIANDAPAAVGADPANSSATAAATAQQNSSNESQGAIPRPKSRVNVVSFSGDGTSLDSRQQIQPVLPQPVGATLAAATAPPAGVVRPIPPGAATNTETGAVPPQSTDIRVIPAPRSPFMGAARKQAEGQENVQPRPAADGNNSTVITPIAAPAGGVKTVPGPAPVSPPVKAGAVPAEAVVQAAPPVSVQQVPPLALVTPATIPAPAQKRPFPPEPKSAVPSASSGIGQRQPVPVPPMAPSSVPNAKQRRTDGKQEIVLTDNTVFTGKISSQTDHVLVFSSEGASITILKRLIKSIDGEPYRYVKSSAGDTLVVPASQKLTAQPQQQVRKQAVTHALYRILPAPELPQGATALVLADSMQKSIDWQCRSRSARYLGAMGPWGVAAVPSVTRLLGDTAQSGNVVPDWIDSSTVDVLLPPGLEAARALAQLGAQGEAELLQALKNGSPLVRRHAVFGLGNCFLESAEKAVKGALKDADPSVRRAALGSLRVTSSFPELLTACSDPDATVRAAAATLLGKLGNRSAVGRLADMTKDINQQVRRAVAEALGSIGAAEAVPALILLCQDTDNFVRAEAVRALGKTKDGAAAPPLINALKDQAADVRAGAAEALGFLRDSRAIPSLYALLKDKNKPVREKAQFAIRQHTELPLLIAALDDESTTVRTNAAYVLWLMTGQDNGTDKDKWEKWAALKTSKGAAGGETGN